MKKRIDQLLVDRGIAADLKEAAAFVMSGEVLLGDHRADKPGVLVAGDARISLKEKSKYVSRAGDKLASVLGQLNLEFVGKVVLDVGSSTGGFTDVALQNGASKVYCVDVGTAQLAFKLRQDPRVVVKEKTDIRELKGLVLSLGKDSTEYQDLVLAGVDMAVIDVSFIKLEKILPAVAKLIKPDGIIVAMMKPQFEAEKAVADRFKGVISDEAVRQEIIGNFRQGVISQFEIVAEADSNVLGSKGNRERFFVLTVSKDSN